MSNNLQTLEDMAKDAFARVEAACPEDAKTLGNYIAGLRKKNVIALGEGEAFALTDAEGRGIRATKRTVRLSAENGGLIQPVYGGPYVISAPGYAKLAHAAGAVCMNAPTVTVDGIQQQNPYVRRDADGGIIEVHCRALAFRYNEVGQPMVSDRTTIFDTATYALADMVGKAKRAKDAFKLLPATQPAPAPAHEWACYKVDPAVNLWMKITHDEVINFLGQVLNRKKKALEFAQTFAQRNALKHLFGIAVVPGQEKNHPISVWDVPIVCWTPSDGGFVRFDTSRYTTTTEVIDALSSGKPVSLPESHQPIIISRGTEEVNGADMDQETDPAENPDIYLGESRPEPQAAQEITVEANSPEPRPAPVSETAPAWTQQQMKDWQNLEVVKQDFDMEYAQALDELGLAEQEVNPGNAATIVKTLGDILDRGQE